MSTPSGDRQLVKRRHLARAGLLKRRITAASALGFAALFALAAQHVVRGATTRDAQSARSTRVSAGSSRPVFFDERDGGFSFDDTGSGVSQDLGSAPPPVAQTSVS